MIWLHYRVPGMTCPNESGPIRESLMRVVDDETHLRFDLMKSKLSVHLPSETCATEVIDAVALTGFTAEPSTTANRACSFFSSSVDGSSG